MRSILFIATLPPPITGQSVACEAFRHDLIARGHVVDTINLAKASFLGGVTSFARIIDVLKIAAQVFRKRKTSDLVYFTASESIAGNLKDLLILALLGKHRRQKTFLHLHGGAGMRRILSSEHPYLKSLNRHLLRDLAGVIVLGERLSTIYDGIVDSAKIHIVKNFASDEAYASAAQIHEKHTEILNIDQPINVLYLSNLLAGKGYLELLSAIESLPDNVARQFHFDFAGGFESTEAGVEFIKRLERLKNVRYHGTVQGDQKARLLAKSHVFTLPTYYAYEGQPISILEAYAAGCAVITTDHSGIFDIFTPGVNGWQVLPRDNASLMNVLLEISRCRDDIATLGRNNGELARANYRCASHLLAMRSSLGFATAA
jgi:glycosyltransferase involved in cell wall biosynthesis